MDDRFYTRTVTCSVRAEQEWFDKVKEIAEKLGMNRNQFIVYVVNEYIKDKDNNE
jgi:predicted DNA-binding ribbon-helix-helix protein